jgi:quercetin dioxygenase-like cupin family protein
MQINNHAQIVAKKVDMAGAQEVTMKILIGPQDGSEGIIMRHFTIRPNGHTPRHQHNYEHLVRVLSGQGVFLDHDGREHVINASNSLFVKPNELHQFQNPFGEDFEFLCIIPNPEAVCAG